MKSIDELACKLDRGGITAPEELARRIKDRIRKNVGEHITCSIGFAPNRMLAKIACKVMTSREWVSGLRRGTRG